LDDNLIHLKKEAMMKMTITEEKRISDIQAEFNRYYPYLKLEFFWGAGKKDEYHRLSDTSIKMENISHSMHEGAIQLSDNMTVSNLEDAFSDRFGLQVQVFRKSGSIWLETTKTDNWTLKVQNDHGKEISN